MMIMGETSEHTCTFLRDEVLYLGHVISVKGVRPDSAKTEKVKCFPIPRDISCVHQV